VALTFSRSECFGRVLEVTAAQGGRFCGAHTPVTWWTLEGMKPYESNLSATGATTVPKRIRSSLNAPLGGCLVWTLQPDGSIHVRLRYAAAGPRGAPVIEGQGAAGALGEA
jgi:hypothetical protein